MAKEGFGMKVIGLKRDKSNVNEETKKVVDEIVDNSDIDHILKESDFIVSILPNTPDTVKFLNIDHFRKMKESSVLINIGRGTNVN